jgi:hypothetical protein
MRCGYPSTDRVDFHNNTAAFIDIAIEKGNTG